MKTSKAILISSLLALGACGDSGTMTQQANNQAAALAAAEQRDLSAELLALTDEFMLQLLQKKYPYLQMMAGQKILEMPDISFEGAQKHAADAEELLMKLKKIDLQQLGHDDQMTYEMFQGLLESTIEGPQHFWQQFNVTPYTANSGPTLLLPVVFPTATFGSDQDIEDYLAVLEDVARYVEDDLTRLKGQAERGIRLPKAAIPGVRTGQAGFGPAVMYLAKVSDERMASLDNAQKQRLSSGIDAILNGRLKNALDALQAYLGDDYVAQAPDAVGMGQYPGGPEAYRFAIRQQTTLDLSPEEIHQRGLAYMAEIQEEMKAIRKELGFEGTQAEFHEQMRQDPRFYANSPEEVAERYMAYIRRIEPHIKDYFSMMPKADYGVQRLDPAAEPNMTFGFYQAPSPTNPTGYYRFNGSKLDQRPMVWTGGLIYHELIPGHHFHIALAKENEDSSEFLKMIPLMYAAFTEGWANYAASLSYEMGIMDDPWDRYGWLLFNSFITNRLVVDTGMNALGWPLEKARAYMTQNTFSGEDEVLTETLRYSTDIPAQSLAYKLGYEKIREIRRTQEEKLGDKFDIKKFHAATVGNGGMPLPQLERHVDWYMQQ